MDGQGKPVYANHVFSRGVRSLRALFLQESSNGHWLSMDEAYRAFTSCGVSVTYSQLLEATQRASEFKKRFAGLPATTNDIALAVAAAALNGERVLLFGEFCWMVTVFRRLLHHHGDMTSQYPVQLDNRLRLLPSSVTSSDAGSSVDAVVIGSNVEHDCTSEQETAAEQVFLGGSCNPTTWRSDIAIPWLDSCNVTYFNPQVDDWYPELIDIEREAKRRASLLLFVVDDQTRAVASLVEAAYLIGLGRLVVTVVRLVSSSPATAPTPAAASSSSQIKDSISVCDSEVSDLNNARAFLLDIAENSGTFVFSEVREAMLCVTELFQEHRRNTSTTSNASDARTHTPPASIPTDNTEPHVNGGGVATSNLMSDTDTTACRNSSTNGESVAASNGGVNGHGGATASNGGGNDHAIATSNSVAVDSALGASHREAGGDAGSFECVCSDRAAALGTTQLDDGDALQSLASCSADHAVNTTMATNGVRGESPASAGSASASDALLPPTLSSDDLWDYAMLHAVGHRRASSPLLRLSAPKPIRSHRYGDDIVRLQNAFLLSSSSSSSTATACRESVQQPTTTTLQHFSSKHVPTATVSDARHAAQGILPSGRLGAVRAQPHVATHASPSLSSSYPTSTVSVETSGGSSVSSSVDRQQIGVATASPATMESESRVNYDGFCTLVSQLCSLDNSMTTDFNTARDSDDRHAGKPRHHKSPWQYFTGGSSVWLRFTRYLRSFWRRFVELHRRRIRHHHMPSVFLAGSCGSSTWREEMAAPLLRQHRISYYNPQLPAGWSVCQIPTESYYRDQCEMMLVCITADSRSAGSMVEAAYRIGTRGNLVISIQDLPADASILGIEMTQRAVKDYNRGRSYLRELCHRHGVPLFEDVALAVQCCVSLLGPANHRSTPV
ncbi:streptococcal hemagglutinin-like [Sycon ciliatum]|uniref:streptococcal hemagglutinin-like n=1 Tax=Sycon ciliatum TaxID=27933 RepID=UPI0031F6C825